MHPSETTIIIIDLRDRETKATLIAENPQHFKVCEGCESIVVMKAKTCPKCKAYRFEDDPAIVAKHAMELGRRLSSTEL
jgi:hypothetical protein